MAASKLSGLLWDGDLNTHRVAAKFLADSLASRKLPLHTDSQIQEALEATFSAASHGEQYKADAIKSNAINSISEPTYDRYKSELRLWVVRGKNNNYMIVFFQTKEFLFNNMNC
jgi:hypothetical protein